MLPSVVFTDQHQATARRWGGGSDPVNGCGPRARSCVTGEHSACVQRVVRVSENREQARHRYGEAAFEQLGLVTATPRHRGDENGDRRERNSPPTHQRDTTSAVRSTAAEIRRLVDALPPHPAPPHPAEVRSSLY